MTRRYGWRGRAAWLLRWAAARLDDRRAYRPGGVIPSGYAQGRADLQLTRDRKVEAENFWARVDAEHPELRAAAEAALRPEEGSRG